jgi:hypothetical protein
MRNIGLRLTLTVLLLLCLASLVLAQGEQVTLRLKFSPNQVTRYRVYADVNGAMTMAGMPLPQAQGQSGSIPLQAVVNAEATTKVLGIDAAGAARLSVKLDSANMSMNVMGQQMKMTLAGGKLSMTTPQGQSQAVPLAQMFQGQNVPLLQQPITVKLDPRGKLLDLQIPGLPASQMLPPGMDMSTLLKQSQMQLPEGPITVGQSWTDHQAIPYGSAQSVSDTSYTLAGLDTKDGKTLARINVQSTTNLQNASLADLMKASGQQLPANAPPMEGSLSLQQQLAGVMLYNVTDGHLSRFDFQANQSMVNRMTMTVPGQEQPMNMDMNMTFTVKGAAAAI